MYLGGYDYAKEMAEEGEVDPSEFFFFARHINWAAGELEAECDREVWTPSACSMVSR